MKQLYDKSMARTGFTLTLLAKGEVEIGSVCFPSKNCARTIGFHFVAAKLCFQCAAADNREASMSRIRLASPPYNMRRAG